MDEMQYSPVSSVHSPPPQPHGLELGFVPFFIVHVGPEAHNPVEEVQYNPVTLVQRETSQKQASVLAVTPLV